MKNLKTNAATVIFVAILFFIFFNVNAQPYQNPTPSQQVTAGQGRGDNGVTVTVGNSKENAVWVRNVNGGGSTKWRTKTITVHDTVLVQGASNTSIINTVNGNGDGADLNQPQPILYPEPSTDLSTLFFGIPLFWWLLAGLVGLVLFLKNKTAAPITDPKTIIYERRVCDLEEERNRMMETLFAAKNNTDNNKNTSIEIDSKKCILGKVTGTGKNPRLTGVFEMDLILGEASDPFASDLPKQREPEGKDIPFASDLPPAPAKPAAQAPVASPAVQTEAPAPAPEQSTFAGNVSFTFTGKVTPNKK